MNILIVSQQFFPRGFGGGPYQVKALANGLDKEGQNVYFVGPKGGEEYLNEEIDYYGVDWDGWINKALIVFKIRRIVREENIDIVHSQFAYPAGVLSDKALYLTNVPHVITSHGVDIRPPGENSYLTDTKKRYLIGNTLERVDEHIVASGEMEKLAVEAGSSKNKVSQIPNILPEMPDVTDDEASEIVKSLDIDRDYILSLSRLHPIKNIDDMLKALDRIREEVRVDLVIAGDGDEEEELRREVEKRGLENRVIFTGRVDGKTKTALYKQAMIFCIASEFEAFPLTSLEAMNFCIPIVASDVGGMTSAVRDQKEALLFEEGNIDELSDKLSKLIKNSDLRSEIKESQSKRFEEKFSVGNIIKEHLSIYQKLV